MELFQLDQYIPLYCEDIYKMGTQMSPLWYQTRNNLIVYKFDRRRSINFKDFMLLLGYNLIHLYDGQRLYLMYQVVSHYVQEYLKKNKQLESPFSITQIWIMLTQESKVFGPGFDLHDYSIVFIKDIVLNNENGLNQQNLDESFQYFLKFFKDLVLGLNSMPHYIIDENKINKMNSIIELFELLKKEIDDNYNHKEQKLNKGWFQSDLADIKGDWLIRFNKLKEAVPQLTLRYDRKFSLSLSYLTLQNQLLKQQSVNLKQVALYIQSHKTFRGDVVDLQQQQIKEVQNKLYTLNEQSQTKINKKIEQIFKFYFNSVVDKIDASFQKEFKMTEPKKLLMDNEKLYLINFNTEIVGFYLKGGYNDLIYFVNNIQENNWKLMFQSTLELMKDDYKQEYLKQVEKLIEQLQ